MTETNPKMLSNVGDDEFDLKPYILALLNGWKILLGAGLLAAVAVIAYSIVSSLLLAPPSPYRVSARLIIPSIAVNRAETEALAARREFLVEIARDPSVER